MDGGSDEDYQFELPEDAEIDEEPARTVEEAGGETTEELPLVERPAEQNVEDLPVNVEQSVEPEHTEKSKKKKRKRTSASSERERGRSSGRHVSYKDAGFVEDKHACAKVLYALKHPGASADIPPVNELVISDAYARYARAQLRSQAFLNTMFVDYQKRLDEAQKAAKDTEHLKELRANFAKQCETNARLFDDLRRKTDEVKSLRSELAETSNLADRQVVELKAQAEYSIMAKTRADRLRERLIYLNKVKGISRKADQARSTLKAMQRMVSAGVKIPNKFLDKMEKDATEFEAKLKEIEPVELEEGDLSPLGAYVPSSDEFQELLAIGAPVEHGEDMRGVADQEIPERPQDPADQSAEDDEQAE